MHACIVVSLMVGVRLGEARAIGWEEDVDLDGDPPSVAVLRADRAGGDTKTPRSRRALKLAQMAVGVVAPIGSAGPTAGLTFRNASQVMRLARQSTPGATGDVPDGDRVFGDLVQDPVPAYPQPPQVRRPIRERPGRAGVVS
jgi:hypothetical protein